MAVVVDGFTIDESELGLDQIDYSDLELKYEVPADESLDNYVIVDGAPVAPESKVEVLKKVLAKVFATAGKIKDIHMPLEDGKTKGFLFIEFQEPGMADQAVRKLNNKKLDVKHTLLVNKLSDIEKYAGEGHIKDEFEDPEVPEFKPSAYLKSWLQDEQGRDQYLLQRNDIVATFWNNRNSAPEPVVEPKQNWTNSFMKISPKGSYFVSIHDQGVQVWGGPEFERIRRFAHPNVRLVDFSPCENFLVSLSPTPIELPPDDHPARKSFPFGPESEGHKLIIWDIKMGLPVRTFALPPNLENESKMVWPLVKWSFDDKYCARMGPDALAVYETQTFSLIDKKLIKIEGIVDFEWSPAGIKLASSKEADQHILSYWTPEQNNQTARVSLMQIPSKEVLRTVNLFQVTDCKLHWQDEGKFLCCKVDKHTKSKKTIFSSLEFFQVTEKDIPVEKIELKETVINFAWEPRGERFVTISVLDVGVVNPAIPRNIVSFYAPEEEKQTKKTVSAAAKKLLKKWTAFEKLEDRHCNTIAWSPKGRFVVIATILANKQGQLDFFDLDFDGNSKENSQKSENKKILANLKQIGSQEYFGLTDIAWDPSGFYLAAWSSSWRHTLENGYKLYDFAGHMLREELLDGFKVFEWRPRPASLLSSNERKKVRKALREYSAQFDELDAMELDTETRDLILRRRLLLEEWMTWRSGVEELKKELGLDEKETEVEGEEIIEEIKEEVLEEKEEVVE